jgi:hypothetical protein
MRLTRLSSLMTELTEGVSETGKPATDVSIVYQSDHVEASPNAVSSTSCIIYMVSRLHTPVLTTKCPKIVLTLAIAWISPPPQVGHSWV